MTNLNLTINGAKASLNGNYVNFSVPMVALTGGDGDTSHYLYTIGYQSNPSKIISMEQVNYETESQFTWSNGWSTAGYSYNPAQEIWSSPYFYCIKGKDASGNVGYTLPLKATKNSDGTYSITGWENGSSTTNSTSYSLSGASSVIADAPLTLSVQANNRGPSADTVIAFSDGGAGGTFTPENVTIPAGSNSIVTATYSNSRAEVITISTTNNGSLADPNSISVTITEIVASTSYTLTGPDSATVGVSQTLTLLPNNSGPANDVVVTLSDNNAGGTFTPSTVTFPAKNTAEQNVSYTPKSTGTVSISSTNNGSLVDPSGISMVVAAAPIPSTSYTLTTTATGTAGTPPRQ